MARFTDNNGRSFEIKRPDAFYYALMLQNELNPTEEMLKSISKDVDDLKKKLTAIENKLEMINQKTTKLESLDSNIHGIHANVLQLNRQINGMSVIQTLQEELTAYKNDFYHKLIKDKILDTHIYVYRKIAFEGIQKDESESKEYTNILNMIKIQLRKVGIESEESPNGTPFDAERMEVCRVFKPWPTSNKNEDGTVASSVVPLFYWSGENNIEPLIISKEEVIIYEYEEVNE